jgi:hypothetical protein
MERTMKDVHAELKDMLDRCQELMGEMMAPQDEGVDEQPMDKEEYLSKPEAERAKIDEKKVMARKPKNEVIEKEKEEEDAEGA